MTITEISHVLGRHKAFWSMEDVEKSLLRVTRYSKTESEHPRSKMKLPLADGTTAPAVP